MDSDVDISRWVLEFLLSDRHMDSVAKRLLAVQPLSDHDWRLNKTLLLRTILSQILDDVSVTETILDLLESIEVLDRAHQIPITDSMRAAYCAVATECTVKFLVCGRGKPSGKYMEAVDRIWRGRVRALEECEGCELVSGELKETRDEVEAGIWDMKVSKKLARMNTRNDALRCVAAYVDKALDPPFIAWAVRFNMQLSSLDQVAASKEKDSSPLRRRHGPTKVTDAGAAIYNSECRKVQEELKSSVLALKSPVTDPLPCALCVSEIVRSELGIRPVDHLSGENGGAPNTSVEMNSKPDQLHNDDHGNHTIHQNDVLQPSEKGSDGPCLSVDKEKDTEYVQTGDVNPGNPSHSYHNNVSQAGLMERNSPAHTFEWDDGLGMSPEQTGWLHLPSPKRNAVSPLKKCEDKKYKRRRYVKRWSLHEEETLRTSVQKYGKGNWKFILNTFQDVFEERTEVDLKDKWRNLTSRGTCE